MRRWWVLMAVVLSLLSASCASARKLDDLEKQLDAIHRELRDVNRNLDEIQCLQAGGKPEECLPS